MTCPTIGMAEVLDTCVLPLLIGSGTQGASRRINGHKAPDALGAAFSQTLVRPMVSI